jgi:hypothetical protein
MGRRWLAVAATALVTAYGALVVVFRGGDLPAPIAALRRATASKTVSAVPNAPATVRLIRSPERNAGYGPQGLAKAEPCADLPGTPPRERDLALRWPMEPGAPGARSARSWVRTDSPRIPVAVTIIVSLLDRRSKKRRGSMEWQAEREKQKS